MPLLVAARDHALGGYGREGVADYFDHHIGGPPARSLRCSLRDTPPAIRARRRSSLGRRRARFALELKDNLPPDAADAKQVSPAVVEASVVNNFYGGNILIAARAETVSQIAHTTVAPGDTQGLKQALAKLGVSDEGIKKLEADIEADKKSGELSLGNRVKGWLSNIGQYAGKEGVKAGFDVAKKYATKWVLQHYGLDID